MQKNLPYDGDRDFAPITLLISAPMGVIVHPSVPAKTLKELVAHAKAQPGKLNYGSSGPGSIAHLATKLLNAMAGMRLSPGPVATDRLINVYRQMAQTQLGDASRYAELFGTLSFGRPASTEEIAWSVAFLASPRSAYTTGVVLTIDGGLVSRS